VPWRHPVPCRCLSEVSQWSRILADRPQFAVMPPSITSSLPVTHEASSEAR
jgi:hypothetical protein